MTGEVPDSEVARERGVQPVDLRSDTVTRPCRAMREAIVAAEVGDDGLGHDPTLDQLEREVAALLGKETAVFVPSGTMANQMAIALQTRPGDLVLCHAQSHMSEHEYGAAARISGVTLRRIHSPDGTLPPAEVAAVLALCGRDRLPPLGLVCLEDTHSDLGGLPLPVGHAEAIAALVRPAALHLDGARLFNAAAATGRDPATIAAPFDTVGVCMSKGLGAPAGSLLCMPMAMRGAARRLRRELGGTMRQTGLLAAAALHALRHHRAGLADDHRRAQDLARALDALPGVRAPAPPTNLVWFALEATHPWRRAAGGGPLLAALAEAGVRVTGDGVRFRAVLHRDVDDRALERALGAFRACLGSGEGE